MANTDLINFGTIPKDKKARASAKAVAVKKLVTGKKAIMSKPIYPPIYVDVSTPEKREQIELILDKIDETTKSLEKRWRNR